MSFYSNLASTVTRLLTKFGQAVTFVHTTQGTYNPATGARSGDTTANVTGYGVTYPYTLGEIDGTMVQESDLRMITDAAAQKGDAITVDSVVYRVVRVENIKPAGTGVAYMVQLRV